MHTLPRPYGRVGSLQRGPVRRGLFRKLARLSEQWRRMILDQARATLRWRAWRCETAAEDSRCAWGVLQEMVDLRKRSAWGARIIASYSSELSEAGH